MSSDNILGRFGDGSNSFLTDEAQSLQALPDLNPSVLSAHAGVGQQIVFVDPGVGDLRTLLSAIKPGVDVVLLDPHRDALDQMAETLGGQRDIASVHIIAHGMTGQIDFSSGALALGNLTTGTHAADLAAIGHAMSAHGDLMIWSCDTGRGATGQGFIDALAQYTGADVAASTDVTGAGSNWLLEAQTGPIESDAPLSRQGMHQLNTDGLDLSGLHIIYSAFTPNNTGGSYSYRYTGNYELGFSDGTAGGSSFDDLFTGYAPQAPGALGKNYNASFATAFTHLGDKVVFVATDAAHGRELWTTDGTAAGTYNITDVHAGSGDALPPYNGQVSMGVVGSELYFAANDGSHGIELWKTDGTAGNATLVKDIHAGAGGSYVNDMVDFGGKLFFVAQDGTSDNGSAVSELWTSDGTSGGTQEVFTLYTGAATYSPTGVGELVVSGSHLFFQGSDGTGTNTSSQIYVTDGTTTQLLDPGVTSHGADHLTDINGTLYFEMDDGTHGTQLWTSDGTAIGTHMVTNLSSFQASEFVVAGNGETFFVGHDSTHSFELWETDGSTAGTQMVKDINPTGDGLAGDANLTVIGNEVYFVAYPTGPDSQQIWETDGNPAHTQAVDPASGIRGPSNLQNVDGTLYFTATGTDNTLDLFKLSGGTFVELASNVSSRTNGFTFLGNDVVITGEPDAFTTNEATAVTGGNLFNNNGSGADTNSGGSLSIAEVNGDAGSVGHQITLASGAHLTVNADGTFIYDPNGAFDDLPSASSGASNLTATETFTYTLTGASSATTVTITIDGLDSNDLVVGTNGGDTLSPGAGEDTVTALGGADTINMGANLDANDKIDGGTGSDIVILNGDYSGGVVFKATTMVNVEEIDLGVGHSYSLTMNNATVAAGQTLSIHGSTLGASDKLTFDGSANTTGGIFVINSGAADDILTGGGNDDTFRPGSGNDTVHAGGGADTITMGASLNAADVIDGGSGTDTLFLAGNYASGVVFNATTLTNVENITLGGGFSYKLTTNNATVAAGQTLIVKALALGAGDSLIFDGSADTTGGNFVINSGAGNDALTGGHGADTFRPGSGNDTIHGGGGDDIVIMDKFLTSADSIDGGSGNDKVTLDGDYGGGVTFTATTMTNIETLILSAGHNYNLTLNNATVAAGQTLTVQAGVLGSTDSLTFDGSFDTTGGNFIINGGSGNDTLIGGIGNDTIRAGSGTNTITGGGGADQLFAGSGADQFVYNAVGNSTGSGYDTVHGFDALADSFKFTGFAVNAIDSTVSGHLSLVNFDAHLEANIGASDLAAHDAVLFTVTSGGLHGHTFLVVDANGVAGYQAGQDFVIDVTGASHLANLTASNFVS